MNKGEKLELPDITLDPQDLEYMDFGKNQYDMDWCRYYFKTPALSKDYEFVEKTDFEKLKEFAVINGLIRNTDVQFLT